MCCAICQVPEDESENRLLSLADEDDESRFP